jgi:hypothetical protein
MRVVDGFFAICRAAKPIRNRLALPFFVSFAFQISCVPRARMCDAPIECGSTSACVAGRCQPSEGVLAISEPQVRRIVVNPEDVALVRPNSDHPESLPFIFTLGRTRDAGAMLLLRFAVPLPHDTKILEAYVMLDRTDALDADPTPITLHAARITQKWDARSMTWGRSPHLEETRSPSTTVRADGPSLVRIDVRDLVRLWLDHDVRDQGIAIVTDVSSASGMPFAFAMRHEESPTSATASDDQAINTAPARSARSGSPRLELYVR